MRLSILNSLTLCASVAIAYTKPLQYTNQAPMNPGPVIPADPESHDRDSVGGGDGGGNSDLTISDILPRTRAINIFTSLVLDTSLISRLESSSPNDNTTLLAPLNSAMQSLPRKPWEDRPDDQSGVSAAYDENKAAQNILRFVREHVVPESPWKEGKENGVESLGGQTLWWEERNGKKVIMPAEVVVDKVLGTVNNGEVWGLKGVINYPVD